MKRRYKILMAALGALSVVMTTLYVGASAQIPTTQPVETRYQLLLTSAVANPSRTGQVTDMGTRLIQDRVTGQCFLVVGIGDSIGLSAAECAR